MAYNSTTWSTDSLTSATATSSTTQNVSLDGTLTVAGNIINGGTDLTIDSSGDIVLSADGDQITMDDGSTTRFAFNVDSTPELDVTGTFTLDCSSSITLDSASDIVINARGGCVDFYDDSVKFAEFIAVGGGRLRLYDDADDGDYLNINVQAAGRSYISTTDSSGAAGHLDLVPDGDLTFNPGTNNIYFGASNIFSINGSSGNFTTIGTGQVLQQLIINSTETGTAILGLYADEGDDAGDKWRIQASDGGALTFTNDMASADSYVSMLDITPHATATSSSVKVIGHFACNSQTPAAAPDWTVNNKTGTTRTLDCDETDTATLAENLGQLVNDLIGIGILQ